MTREELSQKLLEIDDLKGAIDKLSPEVLSYLDIKVYSRPISGYYNAYDYMLSSKKGEVKPKFEDKVSKEIIIPKIKEGMTFNSGFLIPTDVLLSPWPDSNKNVLEHILENPITLLFCRCTPAVDNLEVIKNIIKHGDYSFLNMVSINLYNEKITDDKTILDIMIEHKILPATKYVTYNSNLGILENSCKEPQDILLAKVKEDKTLLEVLLENNIPFIFDKDDLEKAPLEVKKAILLICTKENRLDLIRYIYDSFVDSTNLAMEKMKNYNQEDTIKTYKIPLEFQDKVKEFYQVYATGTSSSKEILDLAVKSFLNCLGVNKTVATDDMDCLIWIKQEYPHFHFEYNKNKGSFFSADGETISIENSNCLAMFNHELAHALHHYIIDDSLAPSAIQGEIELGRKESYDNLKMKAIYNELNSESASLTSKIDSELKRKFGEFIIENYGSLEAYEALLRAEFQKVLTDSTTVRGYIDENFSSEVSTEVKKALDSIITNMDISTAVSKLTNHCLQVEYKQFEARLFDEKQAEFLMYYNFIDAYYQGAVGELAFKNDINNSFYSVHGLTYFLKDKDNQYREMLADYVALLKSPNGKYYIDKLREKGFGSIIDKIDKVYRYSGYEESASLQ